MCIFGACKLDLQYSEFTKSVMAVNLLLALCLFDWGLSYGN